MASWEHLAAMLPGCPNLLSKASQAGQKARKTPWCHADNKYAHGREREKGILKVNERRRNVYENKGPASNRSGQSWNVIENKGS
jgi:hypothetical protein